MKNICLAVCAISFIGSNASAQFPNRPVNGFIVDKTSTINRRDTSEINKISGDISRRTSGQIMVAVIRSTNGRNPRRFATDLFNHWGIGDKFDDNGILVFAAMQDRKAEIILGDGIDSAKEATLARQVVSDYMMPQFKRGQPSKGIRIAVERCAKLFFETDQALSNQPSKALAPIAVEQRQPAPTNVATDLALATSTTANVNAEFEDNDIAGEFDFEPAVDVVQPAHARPVQVVAPPARRNRGNNGLGMKLLTLLGGGLTMGGAGLGIHRLMTNRTRPRDCEHCGCQMIRLEEQQDDAHLQPAERLEEQLGSVDYDVWVCSSCEHAIKRRFGAWFTRYRGCPQCQAKTSSSKTRTVRSATTMSTGLKEVEETCANCGYHDITEHTIPMIVQSNNTSSNFSSGGSSSFGGGGGGSSSGGGASGSW